MKGKILKTILISLLILSLTIFDFILLGYNVVIAVSENLESQNTTTNISNIDFDAYFKQNESKVHEKQIDVLKEDTLIIHINVKDKGVLNDAKIKIENANFKIIKDKIQNSYIKEINENTNEITLNSIVYGNDIEIEIPVQFNKQEIFDINYFTQENKIKITGTYKDEIEQKLENEKSIKINWTGQTDIILQEKIEKYIKLSNNKFLIQQNITTQVQNDILPREQETLNVKVPIIKDQKPEEITVILNGEKMEESNVIYNKEQATLEIANMSIINTDNKTKWQNEKNEYQVIYIYPQEIGEETKNITIKTDLKTKLYTLNEIQKQDEQNIDISNTGNIVSLEKEILSSQIYKGYLYAKTQNEIQFEEKENIEISYIEDIQNIQLDTIENQFIDQNNQEYSAIQSINYKGIKLNKQNMNELLGIEGNITIQKENGEIVSIINNETQTDENGNININYNENLKNIKIITSKPINQGTLEIKHIKAINGDTNYTKEQLKTFEKLISRSKITSQGEEIKEAQIKLLDTKTQSEIQINNNNLSTLENNENIQFLVTLKSNNEQYDLYKNPKIQIIIPKELNINIKNVTQLNKLEELNIQSKNLFQNEDGSKTIEIQLQGEQKTYENNINEGIQISITADISIEKTVPSMNTQIIMNYTNENRSGEIYNTSLQINLNSKYGVLVVNQLSNYNQNEQTLENIDDKIKEIKIDAMQKEQTAEDKLTILNNYENEITNIAVIGQLPENETQNINNEELKSEFALKLAENVNVSGKASKIYYSTDINAEKQSDTWQENINDFSQIKSFKIEIEDNKIEPGTVINISSKIKIPENIPYEQNSYINYNIYYDYLGDTRKTNSTIKLQTNKENQNNGIQTMQEEAQDIQIEIKAKTGGKYLNQGDIVKEGQAIKYTLKLTNKSNEDITNIKITANHTNAIFYDTVTYNDGWDSATYEENIEYTRIEENEQLKEKVLEINELKAGESIELNYQFSIKQVEGDDEETSGEIKIQADNIEEKTINTLSNKIEQSELKLQMRSKYSEEYPVSTSMVLPFFLDITNISETTQNDILINIPVPEGFSFETDLLHETEGYEFVEYKNNNVVLKIPTLNKGEVLSIRLGLMVDEIDQQLKEKNFDLYYTAQLGEKTYISNEMSRNIYQSNANITAIQKGSIEKEEVENGDNLIYRITIENKSQIDKQLSISDLVPAGAAIKSVAVQRYNITTGEIEEEQKLEANEYNQVSYETELKQNERIVLIIDTTIDTDQIFEGEITNKVDITVPGQIVECNEVTYKIAGNEEEETNEDEIYTIQGKAWLDSNKNGMREDTEQTLENIGVMLINEETGNIVKDEDGQDCISVTDNMGDYGFYNIPKGKYLVVFKYDSSKYIVTQYQKEGISQDVNSDVVSKTINLEGEEQIVAITGSLTIENGNLENIDAGFYEGEKFDLRLDKYVSKVIIQNNKGTTVKEYQNEQLAKVEIDAKQLTGSTLIIEYKIIAKNEGEVPGYINEIVDYVPNDLKFSSEMNKGWYQGTDGNLYSKEISDQVINPQETKTLSLTLIKNLNQNNTGTIINTAEISKTSNNLSLQDIDSTPANKKQGEDDMSTAEIIVSIRTGLVIGYTMLIITIILILAVGIYLINKKVLKTDNEELEKF